MLTFLTRMKLQPVNIARKRYMPELSAALVKTWLFYLEATDEKLAKSKEIATKNIEKHFGSVDMAKLYVEQQSHDDIEVLLL